MRASAETVIERPIAAVWEWASDPRNWQYWEEQLGEAGTGVYEVAESSPPRRQVVRSVSGPYRFEGTLELFEDVGGTRVRQTVVSAPVDALGRLVSLVARPLVRRSMRRHIAAQLARLKQMAELGETL
jgi:hypothetical protein